LLNRVDESIAAILQASRVGRFFDDDDADTDTDDTDDPKTLAQLLQDRASAADATLLITLDQFEEYFLYEPQHTEDRSFALELAQAINTPDLDANFLISIREDSLAKLDSFRGRIPNLFDNYLRIDHLDRKSGREAIEQPLKKYNSRHSNVGPYTVEPELVNEVLDQIQTGHLFLEGLGQGIITDKTKETRVETPYLQIVMTRLWDQTVAAGHHVLERKTLNELGGARKIIETHLDAAMATLSDEEQGIAAGVFNFLVTPSGTKIAHTAEDLAAYSKKQVSEIQPMLRKLASDDARVLRTVPPPPDKPTAPHRYEIFHDVLASAILAWRAQFEQQQKNAKALIAGKKFDQALDKLNESERDIAASILSALVTSSGTRAALTLEKLAGPDKLPISAVGKVVALLMAPDQEILHELASDGLSYYEISNETLVKPIVKWCDDWRRIASPESVTDRASYFGRAPVILLTLYYVVLLLVAAYGVYAFWRRGAPDPSLPTLYVVKYLFWTFFISMKTRLTMIALFAGLAGSALHGCYSLGPYVSKRVLSRASIFQFLSIPLVGPAVGLLMLVILQLGSLDKDMTSISANPAGIVGLAFGAGLFVPSYFSQLAERVGPRRESETKIQTDI
jgi:hypothetical protein